VVTVMTDFNFQLCILMIGVVTTVHATVPPHWRE
jgi:hypothetical protein